MGFLIGGAEGVSTWAKVRRAVGQIYGTDNQAGPSVRESHNVQYPTTYRFKAAASGSGLIKGGYLLGSPYPDEPGPGNTWEPTIIVTDGPVEGELDGFDRPSCETQLTGETVTHSGGSFAITAAMFTSPQAVSGFVGPTPISAVGKLASIT